jgi:hypothetical protein
MRFIGDDVSQNGGLSNVGVVFNLSISINYMASKVART